MQGWLLSSSNIILYRTRERRQANGQSCNNCKGDLNKIKGVATSRKQAGWLLPCLLATFKVYVQYLYQTVVCGCSSESLLSRQQELSQRNESQPNSRMLDQPWLLLFIVKRTIEISTTTKFDLQSTVYSDVL